MRTPVGAIDFTKDLGSEPDADRGVALRTPVDLGEPEVEDDPEVVEQEEVAEIDEGQDAVPEEVPEEVQQEPEAELELEGAKQKWSVKDVSAAMDWTLEQFYHDIVTPDGQTLSEKIDGYNELRAENETLRQERQQLEAKANEAQPIGQYAPEAVELMREAQMLQKQYDTLQADGTLDNMDAAESMKIDRKYRYEIERRTRAAQKKQAEHQKVVEAQQREYMVKVDAQLRKDIPAWRNPDVRRRESEAISDFLRSEGADQNRIEQILKYDPWSAKLVRELWDLKAQKASAKRAVKKVERIPKSLRPAARITPSKPKLEDVGKALASAKSRRQRDKILMEADFDDALLNG